MTHVSLSACLAATRETPRVTGGVAHVVVLVISAVLVLDDDNGGVMATGIPRSSSAHRMTVVLHTLARATAGNGAYGLSLASKPH